MKEIIWIVKVVLDFYLLNTNLNKVDGSAILIKFDPSGVKHLTWNSFIQHILLKPVIGLAINLFPDVIFELYSKL